MNPRASFILFNPTYINPNIAAIASIGNSIGAKAAKIGVIAPIILVNNPVIPVRKGPIINNLNTLTALTTFANLVNIPPNAAINGPPKYAANPNIIGFEKAEILINSSLEQTFKKTGIESSEVKYVGAGMAGADGPTHHGAFDLAYLRCIPNIVIGAPSNESICRQMLFSCYQHEGPAAVRYPRGSGIGIEIKDAIEECKIGHAEVVREGNNTAILSFGTILSEALIAGDKTDATVVDMKWVKPLDTELIKEIARNHEKIVTIEDGSIAGGAGSAVNEELNRVGIISRVINLGIPDQFIDHAVQEEQYVICGIDSKSIISTITGFEKTVSDNQSSYGSISKFPNIK